MKKCWLQVTTAVGFFTSVQQKPWLVTLLSSLANLWDHLSFRLLKSSDMGSLLDFFLLGFGDSSGLFFLPADGVFVDFAAPTTCPKSLTSEGSTRVGLQTQWRQKSSSSALFLNSSVGGGGHLLDLLWVESFANGAAFL